MPIHLLFREVDLSIRVLVILAPFFSPVYWCLWCQGPCKWRKADWDSLTPAGREQLRCYLDPSRDVSVFGRCYMLENCSRRAAQNDDDVDIVDIIVV